jgi:catechol 2,3-dioxygenase-like lactoylglutathione lyase family enzyme
MNVHRASAAKISGVAVVSVPVSDPERSKAFYVNQLGFELVRDDDSVPGIRWLQVVPRGSSTSLTLVTWFDTMPSGSLQGLVLQSEDLDSDYRTLLDRGVNFDSPPTHQPWGLEAVMLDPDGNKLVLQQRA